ncbi:MAG: NADH-quinone oxidoreductase subunit N [Halofilum sp. (in: g-proteobacteria)]
MPIGDVAPEIAVILTAVIVLLAAAFTPQRLHWLGAPIALAGLGIAAVLCAGQLAGPPRISFSGVWAVDGAGVWARLLIVAATALVVVLTPGWFMTDRRHGEYYAMLLLSTVGAMFIAGAADLLQLVMGVLLSSVTGYTLAAYHRDWALSVEAGMKYFLIGALANALLVLAVTLLFGLYGATGYGEIAAAIGSAPAPAPQGIALAGLALAVVGIGFKLAAVPAHTWMADVAEGAPAPSAAFLTVVPKIGAAIALARLLTLFPPEVIAWRPLIATLSVATMTLGNLAALWQSDLRRLLGWSSVSQSGYALMAIAVVGLTEQALPALVFFLAGYAAANVAAFAAVTHLRGRTNIDDYRGLATVRPGIAAALTLALLSLVGIPPLAGFVGKLLLFWATIDAGYAWLAAVAAANTVASLFYYLRVLGPMYFHTETHTVPSLGRWALGGTIAAGAAIIGLGVGAQALLAPLASTSLLP